MLLYSAQEGFVEIAKQLLRSKVVDVNIIDDESKNTALMIAIENEKNENVSRSYC